MCYVMLFDLVMCKSQVFGLRAGSSLPFFKISSFGRVQVGQNLLWSGSQRVFMCLHEPIWVSSLFEPTTSVDPGLGLTQHYFDFLPPIPFP